MAPMRVNPAPLRRLMLWLMARAAKLNPRRAWREVSVALLDDDGITRINRLYLDHHYATDVISFAAPAPARTDCWQGEIFVNLQRAGEIGALRGDVEGELALYLAHGADHLAGNGDYSPAARLRMRRRELRWLRVARSEGLLGKLVAT